MHLTAQVPDSYHPPEPIKLQRGFYLMLTRLAIQAGVTSPYLWQSHLHTLRNRKLTSSQNAVPLNYTSSPRSFLLWLIRHHFHLPHPESCRAASLCLAEARPPPDVSSLVYLIQVVRKTQLYGQSWQGAMQQK
jgi:hypothetical protein